MTTNLHAELCGVLAILQDTRSDLLKFEQDFAPSDTDQIHRLRVLQEFVSAAIGKLEECLKGKESDLMTGAHHLDEEEDTKLYLEDDTSYHHDEHQEGEEGDTKIHPKVELVPDLDLDDSFNVKLEGGAAGGGVSEENLADNEIKVEFDPDIIPLQTVAKQAREKRPGKAQQQHIHLQQQQQHHRQQHEQVEGDTKEEVSPRQAADTCQDGDNDFDPEDVASDDKSMEDNNIGDGDLEDLSQSLEKPKRKRGRPRIHPVVDKVKKERKRKEKNANRVFKCYVCEERFPKRSILFEHARSVHSEDSFTCQGCNKSCKAFEELYLCQKSHVRTPIDHCDICNKKFFNKRSFGIHMKRHEGLFPYKCEICNKAYTEKRIYEVHLKRHAKLSLFKCDTCEKSFTESYDLTKHIKNVHQNIYSCYCPICGRGANGKAHLERHIRTHTGEKANICDICGMSFSLKFHMERHILQVHEGKKQKRWQGPVKLRICGRCGKSFRSNQNLKKHEINCQQVINDVKYEV